MSGTGHGAPEIVNTDQGSQFISKVFADVLKAHGVAISIDGKGRWIDNVFVERLWHSVKYEDVYLRIYETPTDLRAGLARYFEFYNGRRRHSALDRRTPDEVYLDQSGLALAGCLRATRISPTASSNLRGPFLVSANLASEQRVFGVRCDTSHSQPRMAA